MRAEWRGYILRQIGGGGGGGGVKEGGRQTVAVGQGIGWQSDSIGWE